MDFFFGDDARQRNPSRPGMGSLVAIGGVHLSGQSIRDLERILDTICMEYGFPPGEEFKWSPGRELWMYGNLVEERRSEFFTQVLNRIQESGAKAIVIIEDTDYNTATGVRSSEEDVARLFLERIHNALRARGSNGIVIVDRPSGSRAQEDKFLVNCLETLQSGTRYVKPDRIALNVLSTPSKLVRLLQVADVVTSCTLATVAGETRFSPPVFAVIRGLLHADTGRIGGVGLKIHPDFRYGNLYHWLLGDEYFIRGNVGIPLPHNYFHLYNLGSNEP